MRESIVIQVGQCGNQIGSEFWRKISSEHDLNPQGYTTSPWHRTTDRKEVFSYETVTGTHIPRSLHIDLEPRVIQSLTNPSNTFVDASGCGAGNNWAHGYSKGTEHIDEISEMVQREVESADNLESLVMMHSVAGGTGSGFGSRILEMLGDFYPKKLKVAYSIFSNNVEVSDVVVQPYNSMLAMQRLALCCDCVVVMDNGALSKMSRGSIHRKNDSNVNSTNNDICNSNNNVLNNYSMMNDMISTVIAASTSTLRFPTYYLSDLRSILTVLVPVERLKFIVPSYTPFTTNGSHTRKSDCYDMLAKLVNPNNKLASMDVSSADRTVSIVNFLSCVENRDVQKSVVGILERGGINFVNWMPPSFYAVVNSKNIRGYNKGNTNGNTNGNINGDIKESINEYNSLLGSTGLSLSNGTGIVSLLGKICEQFDRLKRKNAFVEIYKKFSADLSEFDECREVVQGLTDSYENL